MFSHRLPAAWASLRCRRSVLSSVTHASTATFASSSSPTDHIPAEEYLAGFTNYEQQGIPKDAGVEAAGQFNLQRMRGLLQVLGNPQDKLQVVHIAGSKGKGSTAVLLASILREAGHRVGLYTSPHLHHVTERISTLQGTPIASQQFEALVHHHRTSIETLRSGPTTHPSHFEVLTALALRHFADERVDLAVVETGMGGLTDATNVFQPSCLTAAVITPLGLEHVEALGGSIESIAAAKAGIFKQGRPVVLAPQAHEAAEKVLLDSAAALDCPVVQAEQQVQVLSRGVQLPTSGPACESIDLTLTSPPSPPADSTPLQAIPMRLIGPHQHTNIATATATALLLRQSGLFLPFEAIRAGLASAQLPGRFQVTPMPAADKSAAAAASSPGSSSSEAPRRGAQYVVLDGAHTAESAAALAHSLRQVFPDQPIALVIAMAADKDHRAVMAALRAARPNVAVFTTIPIAGSYHRAAPPGTLAAHWQAAALLSRGRPLRCRELIQASLNAAFEKACRELQMFDRPGVVCVTGSLHAVAAASKLLDPLL